MEQIFKRLVSIPSVCGNHDTANEIIDLVHDYLRPTGVHITRYESHGFPSLVATTRKSKTPRLLLAARGVGR